MKKRQFVAVLAVLGLCSCMALAVHQRWRFPLVNAAVNTVLLPFNEAIRRVSDAVVTFKEDRRMNGTLQEENRRLKEELMLFAVRNTGLGCWRRKIRNCWPWPDTAGKITD